jgi:UDP-N-acetylglucosamine 2-epimerase (non-hydrolysing)
MTIAGTRPELIRLSRVIPALDEVCEHVFVWTGQNYDPNLSDLFFEELGVRAPDQAVFTNDMRFASAMDWVGSLLGCMKPILENHKPDRVLILGDTNSAMSAYVAKRMGIPVYHMEAGNRCYDDRVPEEVNRRVVDACSDVLLPYTNRSRDNLLAEGYPARKIHVTGNPIWEVLEHYKDRRVESQGILDSVGVGSSPYFLVTAHRAENVDNPTRLKLLVESLERVQSAFEHEMLVSVHPRTLDKLKRTFGGNEWPEGDRDQVEWRGIKWLKPLGFHAFTCLEENATCLLSDSGTVQEEACLFGVPSVTLRDVTERPETVDCGSNILAGVQPARVLAATRAALLSKDRWQIPEGYNAPGVAKTVAKALVSLYPGEAK